MGTAALPRALHPKVPRALGVNSALLAPQAMAEATSSSKPPGELTSEDLADLPYIRAIVDEVRRRGLVPRLDHTAEPPAVGRSVHRGLTCPRFARPRLCECTLRHLPPRAKQVKTR